MVELLDAVHQESSYPTVYSYVFDLARREITVFRNHNYRVKKVYSLPAPIAEDTVLDLSL